MFYIYILYSEKFDRYYVGSSRDPWLRLTFHNHSRYYTYTSKYRPWRLEGVFSAGDSRAQANRIERLLRFVYCEFFISQKDAMRREAYLKTNMGKPDAQINIQENTSGDWAWRSQVALNIPDKRIEDYHIILTNRCTHSGIHSG